MSMVFLVVLLLAASFAVDLTIRTARPFQYPPDFAREIHLACTGAFLVGAAVMVLGRWLGGDGLFLTVASSVPGFALLGFVYFGYGMSPRPHSYARKYPDLKRRYDKETRIGVIGGGAAGLTAAEELRLMGYQNVTIIEGRSKIGGKTHSREVQGIRYESGTVWSLPGPYYEEYCLRHGIKPTDFYGDLGPVLLYDLRTGKASNPWTSAAARAGGRFSPYRIWLICKYLYKTRQYAHPHDAGCTGPLYSAPEQYSMNIGKWLDKQGLADFEELMAPLYEVFVIGANKTTPALYMLKLLGQVNRLSFMQLVWFKPHQCKLGNDELFRRIAAGFGEKLMLGASVVSLKPGGAGMPVGVTVKTPDGEVTHEFDKVIWAMPLDQFGRTVTGAVDAERAVFDRIRSVRRAIVIAEIEGLPDRHPVWAFKRWDAAQGVNALAHDYPRAIYRLPMSHPAGKHLVKIMFHVNPETSREAAERNAQDLMEKVGTTRFKVVDYYVIDKYAPYFEAEDVASGVYTTIDALQGRLGIYYTSEIISGGIGVSLNMEHGAEVTQRHFGESRFFDATRT